MDACSSQGEGKNPRGLAHGTLSSLSPGSLCHTPSPPRHSSFPELLEVPPIRGNFCLEYPCLMPPSFTWLIPAQPFCLRFNTASSKKPRLTPHYQSLGGCGGLFIVLWPQLCCEVNCFCFSLPPQHILCHIYPYIPPSPRNQPRDKLSINEKI